VIKGDLRTDLPGIVAQAPAGATVVVYHSSVLWYVGPAERERFARTVRDLGVTWLTSEAPGVVPGTERAPADDQMTVLARDGRPLALADSHGTRLHWLTA
jgi:hypothetical protein